jgi:hypothetical protein
VVAKIKKAIAFVEREKEVSDPLKEKFAFINQTASLNQKFEQLSRTEQGANLVREEVSNLFSRFFQGCAAIWRSNPFRTQTRSTKIPNVASFVQAAAFGGIIYQPRVEKAHPNNPCG